MIRGLIIRIIFKDGAYVGMGPNQSFTVIHANSIKSCYRGIRGGGRASHVQRVFLVFEYFNLYFNQILPIKFRFVMALNYSLQSKPPHFIYQDMVLITIYCTQIKTKSS